MAYRTKHERSGLCRSCTAAAKPGRKYCERHLAEASARVKAGSMVLRRRIEVLEEQVRSLQLAMPRGIQAAE
jgi:predicted amidophosphoribosyltransferase